MCLCLRSDQELFKQKEWWKYLWSIFYQIEVRGAIRGTQTTTVVVIVWATRLFKFTMAHFGCDFVRSDRSEHRYFYRITFWASLLISQHLALGVNVHLELSWHCIFVLFYSFTVLFIPLRSSGGLVTYCMSKTVDPPIVTVVGITRVTDVQ